MGNDGGLEKKIEAMIGYNLNQKINEIILDRGVRIYYAFFTTFIKKEEGSCIMSGVKMPTDFNDSVHCWT
jgi:hypothetical protein